MSRYKMGCWHYYLPSQDPNGECQYFFTCSFTEVDAEFAAEAAFKHYWNEHDGYELGVDQDYEVVLISPTGRESRWMVRAEQTVKFDASPAPSSSERGEDQ